MKRYVLLGGAAVLACAAMAAALSNSQEPAGALVANPVGEPPATSEASPAAAAGVIAPMAVPGTGFTLAFADEFDAAAVNQNDWYYRITGLYTKGYNRQQNVTQSGGFLRIRYGHEDVSGDGVADFTGGGVISRHLFGYGYYEVRARMWNGTPGLHTSFWSMGIRAGNAGIGSDPLIAQDINNAVFPEINQLFEIDGFEHDSPDLLSLGTNAQSTNADTRRDNAKSGAERGVNYGNWNVYGFDYEPDAIRFYINGNLVYTIDNSVWRYQFNPMNLWLTALPYSANDFGNLLPGYSEFDYFRYYRKSLPGVNRLGNPSFDALKSDIPLSIPGGWIENYDRGSSALVENDFYDGTRALRHSGTVPYLVTTKQDLTYLPNGTYTLTARVKSSGGQSQARMRVLNFGGSELFVNVPTTASWTQITIPNVSVTNNKATVAFSSNAAAGQWMMVDKVSFAEQ